MGEERAEEAMLRSVRWLDRAVVVRGNIGISPRCCLSASYLQAHKNPDRQNLFAIIQGCFVPRLRLQCMEGHSPDASHATSL